MRPKLDDMTFLVSTIGILGSVQFAQQMPAWHVDIARTPKTPRSRSLTSLRGVCSIEVRLSTIRFFALGALLTLLAACSQHSSSSSPPNAAGPPSAEDVLLGKPNSGSPVATPRGADGKPLLTGYWKLLREDGKPDGNLAKDEAGLALPYSERGKDALEYNQTKTIDPEARCLITGIPRLLTSVLPFEILHTTE